MRNYVVAVAVAVATVLGAVAGCGKGQSHAEAMRVVCDAPVKCCAGGETNNRLIAVYIEDHVSSSEVINWMKAVGGGDPAGLTTSLHDQLARAKIAVADCPIAATWGRP